MAATVAVSTAAVIGCGEIVEVPVEMSETGATEGDDTRGTAGSTEAPTSGQTTQTPDVDDASTSGPADDGASTGAEPTLQSFPFCLLDDPQAEGVAIPDDGSWGTAALEVTPPAGVVRLEVSLRVSHARVSDLRVVLRAPDDTVVTLLEDPECNGANIDALFQDGAAEAGNEQCAPDVAAIAGTVRPLEALEAVLGSAASDGSWALEITDTRPEATGTLDQVCLVLTAEGG